MLGGMRKILAISTFFATAALLAASIAFAATPTTNQAYVGNTTHGHYHVSITATCNAKNCKTATVTTILIKAGSALKPISGCPYGGYELPTGHINSQGKFSATTQFVVASKVVKFTVAGTFTAPEQLKGTVTGLKACGGTDAFNLKGRKLPKGPSVGATR
jgi:hypothetical protein